MFGSKTYRSPFVDSDPSGVQAVLELNINAPLAVIRHFGSRLKDRGRGGIIILGSMSGFVGYANISIYAGAKAFLRIFAEGLWLELEPYGVDVLELCPGLTRTPAMERLGMRFDAAGVRASDSDAVAREGLEHIGDGPSWIADGHFEAAIAQTRFPRKEVLREIAENYRRMAGTEGGSSVTRRLLRPRHMLRGTGSGQLGGLRCADSGRSARMRSHLYGRARQPRSGGRQGSARRLQSN